MAEPDRKVEVLRSQGPAADFRPRAGNQRKGNDMKTKKTLTGPDGVQLILDPAEIFPDDPGNGTPVMVRYKGGCASYNCATNEGEVDAGRRGFIKISEAALEWLQSEAIETEVERLFE
jgi:hypothetical protein